MICRADVRQVNYCAATSSASISPNLSLASISSGMSGSASVQSSVKRSYQWRARSVLPVPAYGQLPCPGGANLSLAALSVPYPLARPLLSSAR